MKRVLLLTAAALATLSLGACSDMFSPPQLPDLKKDPYDFAIVIPPFNGDGGTDMAETGQHDLAMTD